MHQFRKSIEQDKSLLADLFAQCFGLLALNHRALTAIKNRYLVALYNGKVVSVIGIFPTHKSDFCGYEVTWICTTKAHHKKGLIVQMLKKQNRNFLMTLFLCIVAGAFVIKQITFLIPHTGISSIRLEFCNLIFNHIISFSKISYLSKTFCKYGMSVP